MKLFIPQVRWSAVLKRKFNTASSHASALENEFVAD